MTDEQLDGIIDAQWGKGCMPNQYKAHRTFARAVLAAAPSQQVRAGRAEIKGGRVMSYAFEQTDLPDGDYSLVAAQPASSAPVIQEVLADRSEPDTVHLTAPVPSEGPTGERRKPIKLVARSDLHLSLLMAPHSLNLVGGEDRAALLAWGRDVWDASRENVARQWDGCRAPMLGTGDRDIGATIREDGALEVLASRAADTERHGKNHPESSSAAIGAASQGGEHA